MNRRASPIWAVIAGVTALIGLSSSPVHAHAAVRPSLTAQEDQAQDELSSEESPRPEEEVPDGFVEISTIPVVPNVRVEIDGNVGTTDREGKVLLEVEETRGIIDRIDVQTRIVGLGDDREATWQRNYRLGHLRYAMAFSRHMPVSFGFAGSNGEVIERDVIESMTLKSSLGDLIEDVPLDRPIILRGERVVSTQRGPELRDVEWSVESVIVRETNVVNRSQVRFLPSEVEHVDVPLLFFSADFAVYDMFFRSPIVGDIKLTLPNGDVEVLSLDEDGLLHIESMPRGEYKVSVLGPGPDIERPVVLSRDQMLDLQFLSWLDIAVVGVFLILFLIVPLVVGRRYLRRRSLRRVGSVRAADVHPKYADSPEIELSKAGLPATDSTEPDVAETDDDQDHDSADYDTVVAMMAAKTINYLGDDHDGLAVSTAVSPSGSLTEWILGGDSGNGSSPSPDDSGNGYGDMGFRIVLHDESSDAAAGLDSETDQRTSRVTDPDARAARQ